MRRVMVGYGDTPGLGGQFAYLKLDKFDPADVELDASPGNIRQLLSMRLRGAALPDQTENGSIDVIAQTTETAAVYIPKLSKAAIDEAAKMVQPNLLIFSDRPDTVRELLVAAGKTCDSRPIGQEIISGQAGIESTQFEPQEIQ